MEISLDWLAEFVELPTIDLFCERLTAAGVEVEAVSDPASRIRGVVVAEVSECEKHPQADRLSLCKVFDGSESWAVVCGAPNVAAGQRVAFARPGVELPGFTIAERTIRGVESRGMLCSLEELGLEVKSDGIWVMPAECELGVDVFQAAKIGPAVSLGITPNRPDLLSHLGVAREIAAASGTRLKTVSTRVPEMGPDTPSLARVVIEDSDGCKRYAARVVRNVRVGPSPSWLAQRLQRIGQRPINNVVDVTNYVLHELGHPLHAFDLSRLASENGLPTIKVRSARHGEALRTLDGELRELDSTDVIIADAEKAVAIGGVMGGANSEVSDETTAILLESAWFDPVRVRRTAKRHGLHTEASHRFERGADPGIVVKAIDRCAQLIVEVAGGEAAKGVIDVTQRADPPTEIGLRLDRIPKILGVDLPAENVVQLLEPLEIRCVARNGHSLRFEVPTFRPDLTREIDLIEEVARRVGYDAIPERLPDASGEYQYEPLHQRPQDVARRGLLAAGCTEVVTFGFGNPATFADAVGGGEQSVRLLNPLGEELSGMRTSLAPGLLTVLGRNQRRGARQVRVFEIGTTFHLREPGEDEDERDRGLPREVEQAGILMWGGRHRGAWYERGENLDFADLAGALEALEEAFDLAAPLRRIPGEVPGMNPHAAAWLELEQRRVGFAGQLHPDKARQADLNGTVLLAQVSLEALERAPRRTVQHVSLPRFPGTRRDIAVVAERSIGAETLRSFLEEHAGGNLGRDAVERVRLFDVYSGKPIPPTHVSLAYAIEYRKPDRTLTDNEVNAAFDAVVARIKEAFDVEVRDQ